MKYLIILICVAMIMLVGHMNYLDDLADETFYCDMVSKGYYPDYKGIYDEVCK